MQERKMAPLLKITIVLVICFIFVKCRKDKAFFVICEIGLKANKSRSFTILRGLWSMSDYCFVFWFTLGHVKLRWGSV